MGSIGERLKEARQKKGYSLKEISEILKIKVFYLESLEKENWEAIPGEVYRIGFLRNYAEFLDIDADSLIKEYENNFMQPVLKQD